MRELQPVLDDVAETIRTSPFSFTVGELIRAERDFRRPETERQWLITAGVVLVTLGIVACPVTIVMVFMPELSGWVLSDFLRALKEQKGPLVTALSVFLLWLAGRGLWGRYHLRDVLRRNERQYRDAQIAFGAQGIDFTWPGASLHNEWSFYDGVIETRDFWFLLYGTLYSLVPKRAVPPDALDALGAMLRNRIPKYELRPHRGPDGGGVSRVAV